MKAAVGASTDDDYFGALPERRAFASAWTITDIEDARDIAEILAEHGIEHSWQIDDATGLPTVTIPNYTVDKASEALGAYGFDVGEGMPADFISVDRVGDAPDGTTVYDPETGEWVTPEWGEDVPALEERTVYDPDAGAMYDPVTDSHFDEETRAWYDADGAPVEPDAEYVEAEATGAGGEAVDGEPPALPAPNDEPDFYWRPDPEPVPVERDTGDGEVVDGHVTQRRVDEPQRGGDT